MNAHRFRGFRLPDGGAWLALPRWRDRRPLGLLLLLALVFFLGSVVDRLPKRGVDADALMSGSAGESGRAPVAVAGPATAVAASRLADPSRLADARNLQVLGRAEAQIGARQYDAAIATLDRERQALLPEPAAYLLMGRALEGRGDFAVARDFYVATIDRNPFIADAYWGVATTSEQLGELDAAVGAMRNYLHVESDSDPARLQINQARAAIWEWESLLGRGPWGPTRGIPPGFSADELKRDGQGVAVKMPLEDTVQPDGSWRYEIRHADRIQIYPRP